MKCKNWYQITLFIMLLILISSACSTTDFVRVEEPAAQEVENPAINEGATEDSDHDDEPKPTADDSSSNTNESPQIKYGSFEFEGEEREHMLFIPENYTDTKNYPLVIYLHGHGVNAQWGMDNTQLNQVGDINNFLIF